jgi:superfamily I DNA and/or RNA helicase
MTRVKQARDLFLIIGPPGTGKTSFGLLNTLLEELTEPDSSVLLLSYTNRAVDEICSKLVEEQIDFIRLGSHASCAPEYQDRLLSHRATRCNNLTELRALILQTRVVVGTTTAMDANQALLQLRPFSLAIIDEASQILEPHLMGILSAKYQGNSSIRKMVFIGDHKQLPAVVQQVPEVSRVDEPLLHEVLLTDCRLSLFERLLKKYHADERVVYMLHKQGRMHPDIAQFPNNAFYQGQLDVVPREHQTVTLPATATYAHGIDALLQTRRIAFLHADLPEQSLSDKVNLVEAEMIAATVLRIYERERDHFEANKTVGVIVPYRNQIATVRNLLDRSGIRELHDITIDTVERYQGSQRRYILYGFTVQQPYQLSFLTNNVFRDFDGSLIDRKLNVAMTRAEEHLILVGNTELLRRDPIFSRLIDWVQERHGYFRIATADYLAGHFQV